MNQHSRRSNTRTLWALVVAGTIYNGLLYYRRALTGTDLADGIIGVVLGLYICSHPAANLVDLLFFRRSVPRHLSSRRFTVLWLTLNILVLLIGWLVIFSGTTRLIGRPG